MPPRRLLLSCLLLAACPSRTNTQRPPDDPPPGDDGNPAVVESMPPDSDLAPPAPDDPDAPDEPGEVEPVERTAPTKPAKPGSSRANDQLAETLSPRARRTSRRAATGSCEQGTRQVGETWKVDCNACSCGDDGQSTCTAMACKPTPAL